MHVLVRRALSAALLATLAVPAQGLVSAASAAYQQSPTSGWSPNGTVYAIARVGNTVYLGGAFTSLTSTSTGQTVDRSHLAAVTADTGALTSWNPGADGTVRALAASSSGTVYAGGKFGHAAGGRALRLAAITSAGRALPGWHASANREVRDIIVESTGVYVAGGFSRVNVRARSGVARLSATTGRVVTAFDAHVSGGAVYALARSGATIYLGGRFTRLAGHSRDFSGAVTRTAGRLTSWAPGRQCTTCTVLDLAADATKVYEGIAGPGGRVTAFSKASSRRMWTDKGSGDAQAVAVRGGVVYVGGHFDTFTGVSRHQVALLRATDGALASYAVAFTGSNYPGVWAIRPDPIALRIGGGFRLGGSASRYAAFPPA